MTQRYLSPCVNFQGRAREAMEFYQAVLGGKLDLQTLDDQGALRPAGPGDRITHAWLEADGAVVIASDGHPDYPPQVGDHMGIALGGSDGSDRDRLTKAFQDLAGGGRVKMALTAHPWGSEVGWLTDRFGINWLVSITGA